MCSTPGTPPVLLLTITQSPKDARSEALVSYFAPMTNETGAVLGTIAAGQEVEAVVGQLL